MVSGSEMQKVSEICDRIQGILYGMATKIVARWIYVYTFKKFVERYHNLN